MKQQLLTSLFLLFAAIGFSQVAPQIPGLQECDSNDGAIDGHAIFNMYMDAQLQILEAQPLPAENYDVTFHHSAADAAAGNNLINSFDYYSGISWETIYYRVRRWSNNSWVIGSFNLYVVESLDMPDVMACNSYMLPPPTWPMSNYYSGPGGTGTMIPPGAVITATQTIYIFSEGCSQNESFTVTIEQGGIPTNILQSIIGCGSYTIPVPAQGQYFTQDNGGGMQIAPGTVITQDTTYFLFFGGACGISVPQNIYLGTGDINPAGTAYYACDADADGIAQINLASIFDYTALAQNTTVSWYLTQADAEAGINAIANPQAFINTVPFEQVVYARVANTNGDCHYVKPAYIYVQHVDLEESYTITACDANEDGYYTLSLQDFMSLQNTVVAGDESIGLTLYETLQDAESGANQIFITENGYAGATTTLYLRGDVNFGCYDTAVLHINLDPDCSDNRFLGTVVYDSNTNGCTDQDYRMNGGYAVYTGGGANTLFRNYTGRVPVYRIA
jgi:hypothetical protein